MRDPDVLKATAGKLLAGPTAAMMKAEKLPVMAATTMKTEVNAAEDRTSVQTGHTAQMAIAPVVIIPTTAVPEAIVQTAAVLTETVTDIVRVAITTIMTMPAARLQRQLP